MFDVGSIYTISTWQGNKDGGMVTDHHNCSVVEFSGTLLRYEQAGREHVINTASPAFARAERQPRR
jgi:hypothetical protein